MMTNFYQFFDMNLDIIVFIYGFIFFLMGFGILLKNRQHSRFRLAKALHWLALFGIAHALADWGYFFIPIQKSYTSLETYVILRIIRIVINALSFMFLLQFGLSLWLETNKKWQWLKFLPFTIFLLWFVQLFLYRSYLSLPGDEIWWIRVSDIWSRYLMAFPGALLSGYAIYLQKKEFIRFNHHQFLKVLNLSSYSLIFYGVAAGIIVPNGPVFMATFINSNLFFTKVGLPIELLRAISGLLMAIFILKIIQVFDMEYIQRIQESEKTKAIFDERNRIAQDLHDGIIQSMYATNLQLEVVKHLVEKDPKKASEKLVFCLSRRNHIISQIREYIGELKRVTESEQTLLERIEEIIDELDVKDKFHIKLDYRYHGEELPIRTLYHLTLIIKEAISNVIKHAEASKLTINVYGKFDSIKLEIVDNGKGFTSNSKNDLDSLGKKQGLKNMKDRVKAIDGRIQIKSSKKNGTKISIQVPLTGGFNGKVTYS
ncbi:MAG: sensor histidine kinase [Tepidibacillus sp.]